MKVKSTTCPLRSRREKSAFLTPKHIYRYVAKSKVNEMTDFEVILGWNRNVIIDF